jgi:CBS domain containing-hemolysin-like protein
MNLLYILLALLLVVLNAFFVATEFAIIKVRRTRIEELVALGQRRAVAAREVLSDLDAYLSATQLGITLTSLGLGWIGEPAFARLFLPLFASLGSLSQVATHSAAVTVAFLLITFLHVVFGELAPKTFAIERAEAVALLVSGPIRWFRVAFNPLIWVLNGSANFAVRLMGLPPIQESDLAHSEEELRMILAVSHRSGVLSATHALLLENVLDFADRSVRQIMVPRGDIVSLDAHRSYAENLSVAREAGHTRYPLCDGDLDRVVGRPRPTPSSVRRGDAAARARPRGAAAAPGYARAPAYGGAAPHHARNRAVLDARIQRVRGGADVRTRPHAL